MLKKAIAPLACKNVLNDLLGMKGFPYLKGINRHQAITTKLL
jgi:hypothetical protein